MGEEPGGGRAGDAIGHPEPPKRGRERHVQGYKGGVTKAPLPPAEKSGERTQGSAVDKVRKRYWCRVSKEGADAA